MLQGYLDESGIQEGAPLCLIGGFFGGPGQFKKFGKAWQTVLNQYEVQEFHAKEYWAFDSKGKRAAHPYRNWTEDKTQSFSMTRIR